MRNLNKVFAYGEHFKYRIYLPRFFSFNLRPVLQETAGKGLSKRVYNTSCNNFEKLKGFDGGFTRL